MKKENENHIVTELSIDLIGEFTKHRVEKDKSLRGVEKEVENWHRCHRFWGKSTNKNNWMDIIYCSDFGYINCF